MEEQDGEESKGKDSEMESTPKIVQCETHDLPSVALTIQDLENLEEILFEHSSPNQIQFYLQSKATTIAVGKASDLKNESVIGKQQVNKFDIYFSCGEGELHISGDGTNDSHTLFIEGNLDWISKISPKILNLVNNRRNGFRTVSSGKRIELLNVIAAVGIGHTLFRLLPGRQLLFPPTISTVLLFILGCTIILSIIHRNRVFPYVEVIDNEKNKTGLHFILIGRFVFYSIILVIGLIILKQLVNPQIAPIVW